MVSSVTARAAGRLFVVSKCLRREFNDKKIDNKTITLFALDFYRTIIDSGCTLVNYHVITIDILSS